MRTSLNEIREIEEFLFGQLPPEDALVFEACLSLNPEIVEKTKLQKKVYTLIKMYGRKKLREEVKAVEFNLFHKPEHQSFRNKMLRIFH